MYLESGLLWTPCRLFVGSNGGKTVTPSLYLDWVCNDDPPSKIDISNPAQDIFNASNWLQLEEGPYLEQVENCKVKYSLFDPLKLASKRVSKPTEKMSEAEENALLAERDARKNKKSNKKNKKNKKNKNKDLQDLSDKAPRQVRIVSSRCHKSSNLFC